MTDSESGENTSEQTMTKTYGEILWVNDRFRWWIISRLRKRLFCMILYF